MSSFRGKVISFVVISIFVFVLIGSIFGEKYSRKKYPFCQDEYPQYGFSNLVRDFVTLPYIMGHDTAVFGKFLSVPAEIVEAALIPDEKSWQNRLYQDATERTKLTLKYYKASFEIEEVIFDDLQRDYAKKEVIDIYIVGTAKLDTIPKIKKGSKFVLFLDGVCSDETKAFQWTDWRDCYYVSV